MDNIFDKCFLINLKRRQDRLEFMEYKMKNIHIKYDIIEAENGFSNHMLYIFDKLFKNNYKYTGKVNSPGALGLIFTWKKLLKKNKKINTNRILIIEDDIYFCKKFNMLAKNIFSENYMKYDIIYLGTNESTYSENLKQKMEPDFIEIINKNSYSWSYGTYSISLNQKAINVISESLEFITVNQKTIDCHINLLIKKGILSACVIYPNLIVPEVRDSDNMGKRNMLEIYNHNNWKMKYYDYIDLFPFFIQQEKQPKLPQEDDFLEKKKFVFIIPSYNNEEWYILNLKSIYNQTYKNWRIIYINDFSSDNTLNLVKQYTKKYNMEEKTTIIENKKQNYQAYSRYIAFQQTYDDEFCILLDGDDWLYDSNVLEYLNFFINKHNLLSCSGNMKIYNEQKNIINYYPYEYYSKKVINEKQYRDTKWLFKHLRVHKAVLLKSLNIYDILDQNGDFINSSTDKIESYCCLEQSENRHKKIDKHTVVYNMYNSLKYKNSWYNEKREKNVKDYQQYISNKIINIPKYNIKKKNNILTIIDIENKDFFIILNKVNNEISTISDIIAIPFSLFDTYIKYISKYNYFYIIEKYSSNSWYLGSNLQKFDTIPKKKNIIYNNIDTDIPITYIVSSYNSEKTIIKTLDSLKNQTNLFFSVVIIDDYSSDNSLMIVENYISLYNLTKNFSFYKNNKNLGYAGTLKKAIGVCNTKYFALLDSDDTIQLDTNQIVLDNLENINEKIGLIYSNFNYCDENLKFVKKGFSKKIPKGKTNIECNCISALRVFVKKKYYMTEGYNDIDFRLGAEDKDIQFKMEEVSDLFFINKCLYNYRYNKNSLTKNDNGKKTKNNFKLAIKKAIVRRNNNSILQKYKNYLSTNIIRSANISYKQLIIYDVLISKHYKKNIVKNGIIEKINSRLKIIINYFFL